jgi:hemerythrin superfamily protein
MDAITLLKADHKTVEKLFKQYEKTTARSPEERAGLVEEIIKELSIHAAIEEQVFYPSVRGLVPDQEALTLESIEEHHVVKWILSELDGRQPDDERFEPKVTVLIEQVRHHVEEEEQDMFPAVRAALGRKVLNEIGDAMVEAKKVAPIKPHPRSPDTPPGNLIVGTVAGIIDRARAAVG